MWRTNGQLIANFGQVTINSDVLAYMLVLQAELQLVVRLQDQRKAWPWHFLYIFLVAEDIVKGSSEPPYAEWTKPQAELIIITHSLNERLRIL
jgi:hypothetical protein